MRVTARKLPAASSWGGVPGGQEACAVHADSLSRGAFCSSSLSETATGADNRGAYRVVVAEGALGMCSSASVGMGG